MNERQRTIATTYDAFKRVRRKPSPDLAGEVVNIVLAALGQPGMSGDEWRLLLAHVDCGWAPMPGGATEPQGQATADDFDALPDATQAKATGPPSVANGCRGRATLWD